MGAPVVLSQTVPTNSTPAPNYCFSFWTSGEDAMGADLADGIFGLRVTNVLPATSWLSDSSWWYGTPRNVTSL